MQAILTYAMTASVALLVFVLSVAVGCSGGEVGLYTGVAGSVTLGAGKLFDALVASGENDADDK